MMIPLFGSIEALAFNAPIASGVEAFFGISKFDVVSGSFTVSSVESSAARTAYTVYLDVCSLAYSMPARRIS